MNEEEVARKFCPFCGHYIRKDAEICPYCGDVRTVKEGDDAT